MLHIQQDPIEAAIGDDFRCDVAAKAAPEANLEFAGGDGVFEGVSVEIHCVSRAGDD